MKRLETVYYGVAIYEEYGFYSASIDPTIEESSMAKVISLIDDILGLNTPQNRKYELDTYIIGEFVINKPYLLN